jgi:hypothetical protein
MTDVDSWMPRRDGLSKLDDLEAKALERLLDEWRDVGLPHTPFQSVHMPPSRERAE